MRMRAALLLMVLGLVAGCTTASQPTKPGRSASPGPVTLSETERAVVERDTLASLPDVANASFRTVSASRAASGTVTVCGYINVTGRGGTQTGDKPFVGVLNGSEFLLSAIGGTSEETVAVQTECIQNRVYI